MAEGRKNGLSAEQHGPDVFLARVLHLLKSEGAIGTEDSTPVVTFQHPEALQKILSLDLGPAATSDEELLSLCRDVVKYSVKTGHPHFHNQLFAGVDVYGLAGAWLTEGLNTNQYTYEVGPIFTLVERSVFKHIFKFVGFSDGDGIFAPGGSISNMYAMVLARYKKAPEIKTKGLSSVPPLVAFGSEDCHYSVLKCAHWLGLGTDNVIKVKSDANGRMIPSELIRHVQEAKAVGKLPFFVIATAGTTVLGAFDPLEPLADICAEHGLWLHVDACWGGSLLLSKKHSHVLKGLDRVDSVAWNPHKMLGAPLQCSALIVKEKGLLLRCNSADAKYIFQQDKFYDISYDTGNMSVQCGRKVDAFKLWLLWKARGDEGLEHLVDNAMNCARYFQNQITKRPGFRLVLSEFECTNICFWFIPPTMRDQEETEEWWEKMHTVAPKIKERLIMEGTLMIGYTPLAHKGLKNFFRMITTCHPPPTPANMDHVIREVERLGADL